MPYIPRLRQALYTRALRREMAHAIDHAHGKSGDLNYILTRTIIEYLMREPIKYERLNAVLGVLDAVAREFYEQVVRPYEDYKKQANGDVFADIRERIDFENNPV